MSRLVDIYAELAAAQDAVTTRHSVRFTELGLDKAARDRVGGVGVARIAARRGGVYDLDEVGIPALIFPVWDGPICDPAVPLSYPSPLIDLAAWRPLEPQAPMLTRCGIGVFLGSAIIELPFRRSVVRLFRTPIAWAAAGADNVGAVVLDWSAAGSLLLLDRIVADDIDHGEQINERLAALRRRLTPPLPDIAVPAPADEVSA